MLHRGKASQQRGLSFNNSSREFLVVYEWGVGDHLVYSKDFIRVYSTFMKVFLY